MFVSLTLASVILASTFVLSLAILAYEWYQLRQKRRAWRFGINPLGRMTTVLVLLWMAFILVSLVDIQGDHKLYMSLTLFDHAQRSNWAENILRTGVPPQIHSIFSNTLHPCAITTSGLSIAPP